MGTKHKKIIILLVLLFAVAIILISIYNINHVSVYYRTYTKENGWSKWAKNGETSGNNENITSYEVKIKSNLFGHVLYKSYEDENWQAVASDDGGASGNKKKEIKSIKLMLTNDLREKYEIYYRVKRDNKWSDWYSDYEYDLPENPDSITQIQIKIEKKER